MCGFYLVLGGSMLSGVLIGFTGFLARDARVCGEHTSGVLPSCLLLTTIVVSIALPITYLCL